MKGVMDVASRPGREQREMVREVQISCLCVGSTREFDYISGGHLAHHQQRVHRQVGNVFDRMLQVCVQASRF